MATYSSDKPQPAGRVLQVVNGVQKTFASTTSSTPAATGLEVTITPSSTSSKVLIIMSIGISSTQDDYGYIKLYRVIDSTATEVTGVNSTQSSNANNVNAWRHYGHRDGDASYEVLDLSGNYLDSPSSTSAITYKVYWANTYSNQMVTAQPYTVDTGNTYTNMFSNQITAMEISG
jgi:hypothetical protein